MGRESNDPIVIQSSIALLQERFRQLQRMKEMREERELMRKLAVVEPKQHEHVDHALPYEPSRLFFHFLPPRAAPIDNQGPLSLWSESHSKHNNIADDFQSIQSPVFMSLLPTETTSMNVSVIKLEGSDSDDVDTSLHL